MHFSSARIVIVTSSMFAPSKSVAAKICPTICQFCLPENVTAKASEAEMSLRRVCLHLKGPRNFCPTSLFVFVSFPIFFSNRFYRSVGWSLRQIGLSVTYLMMWCALASTTLTQQLATESVDPSIVGQNTLADRGPSS